MTVQRGDSAVPDTLSYADAVRLLGGEQSRLVTLFDKLTGWAMLAAAGPVADVLGWFDARAELVRLGHDLVRTVSEKRSGLSRYDRTRRLEAAHAVLAVTAFFEALDEADLPFDLAELEITKGEQVALAGGGVLLTQAFFDTGAPVPGPHLPAEVFRGTLHGYYDHLARRLCVFVDGLARWEHLDPGHRRVFVDVCERVLPDRAVTRHAELLGRLAVDFPEVAFWVGLHEHQATRSEVRRLAAGLGELHRVLADISTGRAPDDRRVGLARAYAAELGLPVVASGDVPNGLRVPTLGQAYLPPLCRIAELTSDARPADEGWWADREVRDDLPAFLTGHLTSPGAVRAPLLVLGQPGSGKSVLTRILAAQLPAADFMVVRVVLRDVSAAGDLQDQIEQAIRQTTGDRVDWPPLARSAGDALPVVLLDGFDELLQATGVSQSDYLVRVATFQRREADQGRPVAVLVTTRTSVADRAQPPPGTVAVRLEPFDDGRVRRWVEVWNGINAGPFEALRVQPLDAATVLAHRELAEQPLLLLMLALYDAEGNALRAAGELRRGELYERLLLRFARREVEKHRPGLADRELARAVEAELRRLAVVAFAMFNRRAQWVTEGELEADLAALPVGASPVADRAGLRTPLPPAEVVLGRFFFVHRSRVSGDERRQTYEFLHATFGEYLVARFTWQVVADLVARDSASSLSLGDAAVDDDLLHALLSYAVLTSRAPVVAFLSERASTLTEEDRACWADLLSRLFQAVHHTSRSRRHDGYRPRPLPVPARYAAYSANLLLLTVCVAGGVTGRQLYPQVPDPVYDWHAQALLWRSQLSTEEWTSLVDTLALHRRWADDGRRDITVSLDDGTVAPPPVDLGWVFDCPDAEWSSFTAVGQDPAALRRKTHFECGINGDVVWHALEPSTNGLASTVNLFVRSDDGRWLSPTHAVAEVLSLTPGASLATRERAYLRCAAALERSAGQKPQPEWALLVDRLTVDPLTSAAVAVRVLESIPATGTIWTASIMRCVLALLGRDREADRRLAKLADRFLPGGYNPGLPGDTEVELILRLCELGLRRWPIDASRVESFRGRHGDRRPDLVARMRPFLAAAEQHPLGHVK